MKAETLTKMALNICRTVVKNIFKVQASHLEKTLFLVEFQAGVYSKNVLVRIQSKAQYFDSVILSKGMLVHSRKRL